MDFYVAAIIQAMCFGPLVIGLFLSMKIFNIPDITTDGSYTLGAVITAVGLAQGSSAIVTLFLALAGGALAGSCTALIHTRLRIHALLAGILVMTALYSVNLVLLGRSNMPLLGYMDIFSGFGVFESPDHNTLSVLLIMLAILFLVMSYLLRSDFGIAMRATGDSEPMIRAQGVNTSRMKVYGLAISNALVACSGSLMAQFQGFTDINMGIGIVISGLGAVIIGDTAINFLKVRAISVMLVCVLFGVVIFQLILAAALGVGVDANLLKLTTSLLVLFIVALPRMGGILQLSRR
ncbi:ABC transporter permease [Parapedobacter indicus]|uniref:Putative ABC transport system permease protein n=1 Tax=Parapedobacter indicus TaxID=1477437 RepID=A0A1I3R5B0_9SPHI|nr:ABC transporter permease [Parapedobacter indicus]PPL00334.1 putative ABC transport system permease protein [Parapedobacter indicus]SFJ40426.1 putative ABC transport system permease protein [Parapedobacter indicus]